MLLTTTVLIGVIGAVVGAVAFGVHLVDTLLVLAQEAKFGADARGFRGRGERNQKHTTYFNHSDAKLK